MNIFLGHMDHGPLVYGVFMFIGMFIMFFKVLAGYWLSFAIDIAVFWLVFQLHGGSMAGGFAAMICAMLAGLIFPIMLKVKS